MASIKLNKDGSGKIISYRFRACIGRDEQGKQIFVTKTEKADSSLDISLGSEAKDAVGKI